MSAESDLAGVALVSERLSLRAFTPADAQETFDAGSLTVPHFMAWNPSPSTEAFAQFGANGLLA